MIALAAFATATFVAPFAPPLDRAIACTTTDTRPAGGGQGMIRLHRTLRFARAGEDVTVTLIETGQEIDAPEPYRSLWNRLFDPFHGVPITVRLDAGGRTRGVIDGARSWAAIQGAERGFVIALQRDPTVPASIKAQTALRVREGIEGLSDQARDARLADAVAALLPPPLPALRVGEVRPFVATLRSPAGTLESRGTVTLVAADPDVLRYRVETRTAPEATAPAVRALLDRAVGATAPEARARIEANAAALDGTAYAEKTEIAIDRAAGLLRTLAGERSAIARDGTARTIDRNSLDCMVDP